MRSTFDLLLVDDFGDEVVIVLFLEVVQCLFTGGFLLELFDFHFMMVQFVVLGVAVLKN